MDLIKSNQPKTSGEMVNKFIAQKDLEEKIGETETPQIAVRQLSGEESEEIVDDRAPEEIKQEEENPDLYNVSNFSL
jgi:hypothetical protein